MPNARGERCRRFDAGVLRCAPPRRVGNGRCFCLQQVFDEKSTMSAHAGEKAEKTGDFRCAKCPPSVHVTKGQAILKCPHCGNETYATRVTCPRIWEQVEQLNAGAACRRAPH